jgi:hypothetical protein
VHPHVRSVGRTRSSMRVAAKVVAPAVTVTSIELITDSSLMFMQERRLSYFSGELAKHIITQR